MDSGVDRTQKIVITLAVLLALVIVFSIGYSLYVKAKRAEGELANKIELDNQIKNSDSKANISLTGEAKNSSNFTYDGLVRKDPSTTTDSTFEIVNEAEPIEVPEEEVVPDEEPVPPEEPEIPETKPVAPRPVAPVDDDRPLTAEEIRAIRSLPVDNSPSGNLQTTLEAESDGQYKARY